MAHLSIRVPWHDSGWAGTICARPLDNSACLALRRIGQQRDVQVHKFICAGTLEEALDDLIDLKLELSEAVVGTSEAWITEMSNADLRELLQLRSDALDGE